MYDHRWLGFQNPSLISFGLRKYCHLRVVDFHNLYDLKMTSLSHFTDFRIHILLF